jgi:hypothetical protein
MMNWRGCRRKWSWSNFNELSQHFPGGTEENHENLCQDSRSLTRDLNLGRSEYEAGVLTTRPHATSRRLCCTNVIRGHCCVFGQSFTNAILDPLLRKCLQILTEGHSCTNAIRGPIVAQQWKSLDTIVVKGATYRHGLAHKLFFAHARARKALIKVRTKDSI